jgi:hypothetical protein
MFKFVLYQWFSSFNFGLFGGIKTNLWVNVGEFTQEIDAQNQYNRLILYGEVASHLSLQAYGTDAPSTPPS